MARFVSRTHDSQLACGTAGLANQGEDHQWSLRLEFRDSSLVGAQNDHEHAFDAELIASSRPYLTEHLNRFGLYALNRDRVPEPLDSVREFKMPPRGERITRTAQVAVCDNPTQILTGQAR
jgi:hypothetical protein